MMEEDATTEIQSDQAAIVFGPDGISVLLPPAVTEGSAAEEPEYLLAAAELLIRAQEEGVAALATAFRKRIRS